VLPQGTATSWFLHRFIAISWSYPSAVGQFSDIVEEALASLSMMDGEAIFLEWLDKLVESPLLFFKISYLRL